MAPLDLPPNCNSYSGQPYQHIMRVDHCGSAAGGQSSDSDSDRRGNSHSGVESAHQSVWAELACFVKDAFKPLEKEPAPFAVTDAAKLADQAVAGKAEIKNQGQIASMTLPAGWSEGTSYGGKVGTDSFRQIHPAGAPDATLCFYYRGLPASVGAGQAFKSVLDKPAHVLSESEIKSLSEILRGKDDPAFFAPVMIKTDELNGKKVLVVSGRFKESQEDLQEILVNADGTGRCVQEVYFQAPKDLFARYGKDARQSLQSIDWR